MGFLADTPKPPYYAVIFSSIKGKYDEEYEHTAERMMNLAGGQPGFLGAESVREENGCGITVSYWDSLEAIKRWKDHTDHRAAKQKEKAPGMKRTRSALRRRSHSGCLRQKGRKIDYIFTAYTRTDGAGNCGGSTLLLSKRSRADRLFRHSSPA